jgi:hypothetical protein
VQIDWSISLEHFFQQLDGLQSNIRLLQDDRTYGGEVLHFFEQNLQLSVVDAAVF